MADHAKSPALIVKKSPIHGFGCFTDLPLDVGAVLGEYKGEIIDLNEALRRNDSASPKYSHYILEVDDNVYIDGAAWDEALRYVNHSCEPNCEVMVRRRKAYFVTTRRIRRGEELTIDYSFDDDMREPCFCGCETCRGHM